MLKEYLDKIQNITTEDKEFAFRTHLDNLLNALRQELNFTNIIIFHEPRNDKEGGGAPDFLINKDGLVMGYLENKRVNANLEAVAQSEQIQKYFTLSEHIMLCDYLRFCLLSQDENGKISIAKELRICELHELKSITKDSAANNAFVESKQIELLEFFKFFFSQNPKPINTAIEFASALAQRTRILKEQLIENVENESIQSIFRIFKDTLYMDLDNDVFCDNFAQTLVYTLFLAKLNNKTNKEIDLDNATRFISKSFALIREIGEYLSKLYELDSISWLINEFIAIINSISTEQITKELNQIAQKNVLNEYEYKDPYLHFYETFLSQYDKNLRKVRGVYYTPAPVVEFIIDSIDLILKSDFNKKQGLKSASEEYSDITLLDFATGTGTFLLESFRKALDSKGKSKETLQKDASNEKKIQTLIERFYGFEFLIAPYVVAHLKISQDFKEEFKVELKDNQRLKVFLTNTLYTLNKAEELNRIRTLENYPHTQELAREFIAAHNLKQQKILIITGNPPYNALSVNNYNIDAYKYCGLRVQNNKEFQSQKLLLNEKNPRLNDDYIKFIRFAQNKIDKQESGIFAIISNNSFLDGVTMRGMRWSLLNSFDRIYILNLHGDSNKKEVCPDGSKDDNVFDIMQGVSINVFIKTKSKAKLSNNPKCKVFYYDLWGKREQKFSFLKTQNLKSIAWNKLEPKAPFYLFIPQDEALLQQYNEGWSIKSIFEIFSVGIKTGRDKFCMTESDSTKSLENFKAKLKKFMALEIENARREFNLGKDSRDWKIAYAQKELQDTKNNPQNYRKIHYRPFDYRWIYYTDKSKGFLEGPRGEAMQHFLQRPRGAIMQHFIFENIGISVPRMLKDISMGWNHCMAINTIVHQSLTSGGNGDSTVIPLYLYESENKQENFTSSFRKFIDSKYEEHFSPEQILGYIYAILFHKEYRQKYIDFLKIDFPKILFVESKSDFLKLSKLGTKLINLHLLQEQRLDSSIGKAIFKDTNNRNFVIEKAAYDAESKRLFVNSSLYFESVEKQVWEYKIGGYFVLEKYLKSHKNQEIDFNHFTKIIQALHKSLELESSISAISIDCDE